MANDNKVEVIKIKATSDKSTKTMKRYLVDSNADGISGSLYIPLGSELSKKDVLLIKIKK